MNDYGLGDLKSLPLRDVFENESRDFTPWLVENIHLLGKVLGLDLEVVERESDVGGYSLDIYAHELGSNREVIIENQIVQTDHDHLGKLLTYAAGKNAGIVVWIAERFTEPHQQALNWLNEITDPQIGFFGIEVEIVQIDDYHVRAPRFNIVAQPNEWQKTIRHTAPQPPSPRLQTYYDFFDELLRRVKAIDPSASSATRVFHQNWFSFPVGRSGFIVNTIFAWDRETNTSGLLRVELNINTGDKERNERAFDWLLEHQESIENEIGSALNWQRLEEALSSKIALEYPYAIDVVEASDDEREDMLIWATETTLSFGRVFRPRVQKL